MSKPIGPIDVEGARVMSMMVRGIRGATTVESNTREEILEATNELLSVIVESNLIEHDRVASIIFTTTVDLNAEFPAVAARESGWTDVALQCMHDMNVPGSLERCVRILMHVNTELSNAELQHIYLRDARQLRVDLVERQQT